MWNKTRPYVGFSAAALAVGGLSALLSGSGMKDFAALNQPPLSPPGWIFPVVWTILYVLMGVGMAIVWRETSGRARRRAVEAWALQLAANFFWTILFFRLEARLLAFFWLVGLFVLAGPIFRTIYWGSNPVGPALLRMLGIAAFFVCMSMMCNAILQAAGKERLPIISILIGGAVKIGVNWVLVGDPRVNITGAPIGSICCFAAMCAADYVFLCRTLSRRPRLSRVLGAPMLSCAVMGLAAWTAYALLERVLRHGGAPLDRMPMAAAMLIAIAAAVAVYAVMISVTGALTREDMALIPHGEKIGDLLRLKSAKK